MSRLIFDEIGKRFYETGVEACVLFVADGSGYKPGVAWNGITAINENPSGGEANALYADNMKYLELTSAEEFGAGIECYYTPEEFDECDGTKSVIPGMSLRQQTRKGFGFCYKTKIGNDTDGDAKGYKVHVVYNAKAAVSSRSHNTVNESPEATTLSYDVTTTPVKVNGYKPTTKLEFDSTKLTQNQMKLVEDALYGTDIPEFDSEADYEIGDFVVYNNSVYKFTVQHTGVWDAADTSEATSSEIKALNSRLPSPDEFIQMLSSNS